MSKIYKFFGAVILLMSWHGTALAEIRLPHIFSDHMVLQAGQPVAVWGWADPFEPIHLRIGKQTVRSKADAAGHWIIRISPLERSTSPTEIIVKGVRNSLTISDVLIGEVWLASGQSNMEKPMGLKEGQKPTLNYETELAAATYPDIRLFKVKKTRRPKPTDDVEGVWIKCDPVTLDQSKFSAVAYYFGRKLFTELHTPVGLIDSTWGGTRIELWTPPEGFAGVPVLANFAQAKPGQKVEGTDLSTLYNGMIAPLAPFTLRGMIWYQGESNIIDVDDGALYADKMTALVQGWRSIWKSELPFYYVQVAPHLYHVVRSATVADPEATPRLWEAQTAALALPNVGMVVTTDLVDDLFDIHPRNKKDVGERLARFALHNDYGRTSVVTSGPEFKRLEISDDKAIVYFDHADGGLISKDGKPLTWFTIAGVDGHFYPAQATSDGNHVVVSSSRVAQPVIVRFGWDEAAQPNLANGEGLPALPFRTDTPFSILTSKAQ